MRKRKNGNSGFIIPVAIGTVGVGAVAALFLLILPGGDDDITTVETEDLIEVVGFEDADDVIDRERLLLYESGDLAIGEYLSGNGFPQEVLGVNGDIYVDVVTKRIYRKSEGAWEFVKLALSGNGFPQRSVGVDGDIYVDVETGNIYRKLDGLWESVPERVRPSVGPGETPSFGGPSVGPGETPSFGGPSVGPGETPSFGGPVTTTPFSDDNPFFPEKKYDFPKIVAPTNLSPRGGPTGPDGAAPLDSRLPPPPNARDETDEDPANGPANEEDPEIVTEESDPEFGGGGGGPENDFLKNIATAVVAGFAACWVGGLISSVTGNPLTVKTDDTTQGAKECLLDAGAYGVVKSVGTELVASYIEWALSGFHDTPLLITNPDQFWEDFADREIGRALDTSGFGVLCDIDGAKLDISNLLHLKYRRIETEPPRCTLSQYESNLENFVNNPIQITGTDNVVAITGGDPIELSPDRDNYKTYSVTFNLFEAVDNNGNRINPDDVRHYTRWTAVALKKCPAGSNDVVTHNQLSVTLNVPDDKIKNYKYETGRLREEDVVECIQASKIVDGVEYVVVGKNLRENEGFGGGVEPGAQAGADKVADRLKGLGKYVEKGIERTIKFGSKVRQEAKVDEQIADVERDAKEDMESLTSRNDPTAVASYKYECDGEIVPDHIGPSGEKCLNVYQGADKVSEKLDKTVDVQIDAINQSDELSEVIGSVINATAIGLIRGPLEKGLGRSFSGGGSAGLSGVSENIALEQQGSRWFLTLFDKNDVHTDLNIAKIKHEDAADLFRYIEENVDTFYTLPNVGDRGDEQPSDYTRIIHQGRDRDAYKRHTSTDSIQGSPFSPGNLGSFLGIDLEKIDSYIPSGLAGKSLVDVLEDIASERSKIYVICVRVNQRNGGCEEIETRDIIPPGTLFLFDEDRQNLQTAVSQFNPVISTGKKQVDTLLSIYENTVKAHLEIVGLPSDYEDGEENKRRDAILKTEYATELRDAGVSAFGIVQRFVIDVFETSSAKIFVEEHTLDGSSLNEINQLLFLNDCEREPDVEKVIQYIETDCTIKDFERIVREKINELPGNPEELVYYIYRLGHLTEFIQLPRTSANEVPIDGNSVESFELRNTIVKKYTALGNIFVGEDSAASTRNWGDLAAAQAKREYLDAFGKKYEGKISQTIREFLERVPSRYQN